MWVSRAELTSLVQQNEELRRRVVKLELNMINNKLDVVELERKIPEIVKGEVHNRLFWATVRNEDSNTTTYFAKGEEKK